MVYLADSDHSLNILGIKSNGPPAITHILNDTSNVTDRVFAIFSKLCKILKRKFQGSAKNI